jgi:hypothetical protein
MTQLDLADLRHLAEKIVREIAAGTGFTIVATIGMDADGSAVVTQDPYLPGNINEPNYERLLYNHSDLLRRNPLRVPVDACALVLPELDVAYVHYRDAGPVPAQAFTVGRNPVNDDLTRAAVSRGLAAVMSAIADTQPPHRPTGRAFLPDSGVAVIDAPLPAPARAAGYRGRHRG